MGALGGRGTTAIDELVDALKFSPALTGQDACLNGTTVDEAVEAGTASAAAARRGRGGGLSSMLQSALGSSSSKYAKSSHSPGRPLRMCVPRGRNTPALPASVRVVHHSGAADRITTPPIMLQSSLDDLGCGAGVANRWRASHLGAPPSAPPSTPTTPPRQRNSRQPRPTDRGCPLDRQ
jgi:hypothetical protein